MSHAHPENGMAEIAEPDCPSPEDFSFTWDQREEFNRRLEARTRRGKRRLGLLIGLIILLAAVPAVLLLKNQSKNIQVASVIGTIFGLFMLAPVLERLNGAVEKRWLKRFQDSAMYEKINAYENAYSRYQANYGQYEERLAQLRKLSIDYWKSLSGFQFEFELAALYSQHGFRTENSRAGGDGGVDIRMWKDGKSYLVQCKAHGNPVGPGTVRDLYGTLIAFGGDVAILASLSGFTQGVHKFAKDKPIQLVDIDGVIKLQRSIAT